MILRHVLTFNTGTFITNILDTFIYFFGLGFLEFFFSFQH